MIRNEKLLMGNSIEVILSEQNNLIPVISEYQFKRDVLGILEDPFHKEALQQYIRYVGELTKPLNVVSDEDRDVILFTVPALVQSPNPTVPVKNGLTAGQYQDATRRLRELANPNLSEMEAAYYRSITDVPDYVSVVVNPIRDILTRYGRAYRREVDAPAAQTAVAQTAPPTSYSDEYVDD